MENHELYMRRCLQLASLGRGHVSPNPMVGAVLVYQDRIIGEGYHQQYGKAHAEVNCIASVKPDDRPLIALSTLYISLEPCNHTGKTPPCVDLILSEHIPIVVIACKDPNPKMSGKSIGILEAAGVKVIFGILQQEAEMLNRRFIKHTLHQQPYVILKWASSLDGYLGITGERTKLSNPYSDRVVHQWRHEEDAIWVGYRTALLDNPQLNVRHLPGNNPLRIVYDADLSLPHHLHLFDGNQVTRVYNLLENKTSPNLSLHQVNKKDIIPSILNDLGRNGISSVIIEGGYRLLTSFIELNLWDEIRWISCPLLLHKGTPAPGIPEQVILHSELTLLNDTIRIYQKRLPPA